MVWKWAHNVKGMGEETAVSERSVEEAMLPGKAVIQLK